MFRLHVVTAVCSRNLKQYFSGVLGYVFIFVFVVMSALLAFNQQFFADNLATLDQLTKYFPMLLLFLAPAIAMTVWSDEKRQGTDAILFTLPATDLEILLGKYLAVASVYTIALLFSLTQLVALAFLGTPDWGVIGATYLGYWLAGLALISIAMFASSLTDSPTVAFVVGAILCSFPVLIGYYFQGRVGWERLGIDWYLYDFSNGLILWANIAYFISIIVLMLYLNLIVISRRHWSRGQQVTLSGQFAIRVAALVLTLVAWSYVLHAFSSSRWARIDLTADRVYSLDAVTMETVRKARENERPVTIQAYVSREVPRHYVNTQKRLLGLLRQLSSIGGSAVDVRVVEVTANSPAELEAQNIGIEPLSDRSEIGGRTVEQKIYLGAHLSSSLGDVTLPTLGNDAAIEYELARAIALVTDKDFEVTLGIVETDAFFAGPEVNGVRPLWMYDDTMKGLRKLFKVEIIHQNNLVDLLPPTTPTADGEDSQTAAPVRTPPRVLLVPDPASLTQPATDALIKYIQAGHAVVILADPLPAFFAFQDPTEMAVINAPRQPRISPDNPFFQYLASSGSPKADGGTCRTLMKSIGVRWDNGQTAFHLVNPHPGFSGNWPTYLGNSWPRYYGPFEAAFVFCQATGDAPNFNLDHPITSSMKDALFFHAGHFSRDDSVPGFTFTPLITLGSTASVIPWEELTFVPTQARERVNPVTRRPQISEEPIFNRYTMDDLRLIRPNPQPQKPEGPVCLAAHVTGTGGNPTNVVLIGDLDFLSYWSTIQQEALGKPLDNTKLLINAIEVLAGNRSFVALRNRRAAPRTLTAVEREIERFRSHRADEQTKLESQLREELEKARQRLEDAAKKLGDDESANTMQVRQALFQEAFDTQAQFDRQKEKLEKDREREVNRLKTAEQQQISRLENFIRNLAVCLAPLPALILGVIVLSWRRINENRFIRPERKAR